MRSLKTGLAVLVVLLCMAPTSPATMYYHLFEPLQTTTGEAITGATYLVYAAGTTDTAAIYTNRAGTRNYQGSGETTGADGMIDCYVTVGCYDVYYTHSGRSLSGTLENYCFGIADSTAGGGDIYATSITNTGETVLGNAAGDTTRMYHTLLMGDWYSDLDNSVVWFWDVGDTRRVGGGNAPHFGLGPNSFQLDENVAISWAVVDADSSVYDDYGIIRFDPKAGTEDDRYQTLQFRNVRTDSLEWMWGGAKGALDGDYGTPDVAMEFLTNMPDSAAVTYFRFKVTPPTNVLNSATHLMTVMEGSTTHYDFTRDSFIMRNSHGQQKAIQINSGTENKATTITNNGAAATTFKANNGELDVIHSVASGDSARLDVNRAIIDYLTLSPITGALPKAGVLDALGDGTAFLSVTGESLLVWDTSMDSIMVFRRDRCVAPN